MEADQQALDQLFQIVLGRAPTSREADRWQTAWQTAPNLSAILKIFTENPELAMRRRIHTEYPAGHYYSPVVDPATVEEYLRANRARDPACIPGIQLDVDRMLRFWKDNLPIIKATNFPEAAQPAKRFHFNNGSYPYGDAIMLRTMMMRLQPRRIIEIGSGYTTACMLDTAEDARLKDLQVTCIEPYADRLRRLLRPTDWARVSLIEKPVQCLPPETFDQLASGDILFIDSTHVLKTGSDVHYELFYILPRIRPGVVIHVHDVPYPFEYPDEWVIKQNLSWNEAYMLQAFLMFNNSFEVLMWNSLLSRMHRAELATDYPLFLKNPGSSLWMTRRPAS